MIHRRTIGFRWMACGILLCCLCVMSGSTAYCGLYPEPPGPKAQLVKNGECQAAVVLPEQASAAEICAATELALAFERIAGVKLPIFHEPAKSDAPYTFYIGNTRKATEAGVRVNTEDLGTDGIVIRSIPRGIVLTGAEETGGLFATYDLLERAFGVRWFMPGDIGEVYPKNDALSIGQYDYKHKPSFEVRRIYDGEWSLRNHMNAWVDVGGKPVGVHWKWHFHSITDLLPKDPYFEEHPEWFALIGGKRTAFMRGKKYMHQLCTSNDEMTHEVARNIVKTVDEDPGIEVITLGLADAYYGFCECENCKAMDVPGRDFFGSYSDRFHAFYNNVARYVKEDRPDVKIKIGAYSIYLRTPVDPEYRPEDNVVVQVCHMNFCHNHPVTGEECVEGETWKPAIFFQPNSEFRDELKKWLKLTPNVWVYEYYIIGQIAKTKLPWPLVHTMRKDIPWYRDMGVKGFYTQSMLSAWHRLGLNYYVAAKLAWDADLDVDALLADYYAKFYGPAAEPMAKMVTSMEDAMVNYGKCVSSGQEGGNSIIGDEVFTPEFLDTMEARISEAESLVEDGSVYAERVALKRHMLKDARAWHDRTPGE